jgi:hypothetical protein
LRAEEGGALVRGAGREVGEGVGGDPAQRRREADQHVARAAARDLASAEREAAVGGLRRLDAQMARGELERQRRLAARAAVVEIEEQRDATDDVVGILEHVAERTLRSGPMVTARICPRKGSIGSVWCWTLPSTILPWRAPARSASSSSRSKFSTKPSTVVGKMTSKPIALAPAATTLSITLATSRVQNATGVPLNGSRR